MNKVHDKGSVDLLLSFHFYSFFKALLIIGAPPPLPVPTFLLSNYLVSTRGVFSNSQIDIVFYIEWTCTVMNNMQFP